MRELVFFALVVPLQLQSVFHFYTTVMNTNLAVSSPHVHMHLLTESDSPSRACRPLDATDYVWDLYVSMCKRPKS